MLLCLCKLLKTALVNHGYIISCAYRGKRERPKCKSRVRVYEYRMQSKSSWGSCYLSSLPCHLPLFSFAAHLYDPEHPLCENFPVQNTASHHPCLHCTLGARSYRYHTPITHTSPASLLRRNIGVRALLTIDHAYTLWLKYG